MKKGRKQVGAVENPSTAPKHATAPGIRAPTGVHGMPMGAYATRRRLRRRRVAAYGCPRGVYGRPFAADALPTGCLRAAIRRRRIAHGVSTGDHSPPTHCPRGVYGRPFAADALSTGCRRAPTLRAVGSPPMRCLRMPTGAYGRPFAADALPTGCPRAAIRRRLAA